MRREHYFVGWGVGGIIEDTQTKYSQQFFVHFWGIYRVLFIVPKALSIINEFFVP